MGREQEVQLAEGAQIEPRSPYGISKYTQELLGRCYAQMLGIEIIYARPFTFTGPRQSAVFALPSFARQIAEIEKAAADQVLVVGNLEAVRDYTDVRDIVYGLQLCFEHGKSGEVYNLCSGEGRRIGELLEKMLSLSSVNIQVRVDPALRQIQDIPSIIGDFSKAKNELGWSRSIRIEQTLIDLLNYWRRESTK
jgi:GDP-4-dehydro-6-deoxy-D-mannose reductase